MLIMSIFDWSAEKIIVMASQAFLNVYYTHDAMSPKST